MRGSNIKVSTVTQFILSTKIINTYFSLRIPTIATLTLDLQLSRGHYESIHFILGCVYITHKNSPETITITNQNKPFENEQIQCQIFIN